jgi:hypothetical protein
MTWHGFSAGLGAHQGHRIDASHGFSRSVDQIGCYVAAMPRRADLCAALAALIVPILGCGNPFSIVTNGRAENVSGSHSTLAARGALQVLEVCGDYPTQLFASDTGGSVCITLQLDAAALASLHAPTTLTIDGSGMRGVDASGAAIAVFSPNPASSPAVTTLWMEHDCFCSNPPQQTFLGTVTFETAEARHLQGSLALDITEADSAGTSLVHHVEARFDAAD